MRGRPVTAIARVAGRRWRAMNITQRLEFYQRCGQGSEWGSNLPSSRNWCTSGLSGPPPVVSRSPFINFFVHMYRKVRVCATLSGSTSRNHPVTRWYRWCTGTSLLMASTPCYQQRTTTYRARNTPEWRPWPTLPLPRQGAR